MIFNCSSASRIADAAVDPEAEGDVGARPRPVDDEFVRPVDGRVVAVARDVPHHDLVAFLIFLPRNSMSSSAVRRICASGVCQRITSGTKLSISFGIGAQLAVLIRVLAQRVDAARQRVAGGVVAADDQQDQIAEEILGSMSRVASLCAIIDNRSLFGGWLMRSFQSLVK